MHHIKTFGMCFALICFSFTFTVKIIGKMCLEIYSEIITSPNKIYPGLDFRNVFTLSPPVNTTSAFRVTSSLTCTVTAMGQYSNRQYPLHLKMGALLCDRRVFNAWRLKPKLQYGWTDLIPLAITFVHCNPWKHFPLRFPQVLPFLFIKKKETWLLWHTTVWWHVSRFSQVGFLVNILEHSTFSELIWKVFVIWN